jgi:hypothetical protein
VLVVEFAGCCEPLPLLSATWLVGSTLIDGWLISCWRRCCSCGVASCDPAPGRPWTIWIGSGLGASSLVVGTVFCGAVFARRRDRRGRRPGLAGRRHRLPHVVAGVRQRGLRGLGAAGQVIRQQDADHDDERQPD